MQYVEDDVEMKTSRTAVVDDFPSSVSNKFSMETRELGGGGVQHRLRS